MLLWEMDKQSKAMSNNDKPRRGVCKVGSRRWRRQLGWPLCKDEGRVVGLAEGLEAHSGKTARVGL